MIKIVKVPIKPGKQQIEDQKNLLSVSLYQGTFFAEIRCRGKTRTESNPAIKSNANCIFFYDCRSVHGTAYMYRVSRSAQP